MEVSCSGLDHQEVNNVDDDGKPKRTGTQWTASLHIITALIGSGVLSLPWAMAQLGWIGGVATLSIFAVITCYTSSLLADCYRFPDPITGKRNYTYMQAVKNSLGPKMATFCAIAQYANLCGLTVGYTITAAISLRAVLKAFCFHMKGHDAPCQYASNPYMIAMGILEVFLSQIPNFHELTWLSGLAALMSIGYSAIGTALSFAKIVSGNTKRTTLGGVETGPTLSRADKTWRAFSALGNIAFSFAYSPILIEIQDTLKSSPAENKVMKKANLVGVSTTTLFYMMCACFGYAAFGNEAPGNMLTGFGFYEPFWLVALGNIFIVVHLVGAYQVFSQPIFGPVETLARRKFPDSKLVMGEYPLKFGNKNFNINFLRIVWRTVFVVVATLLSMAFPFFNAILSLLGAIGFWPCTVFLPIQMHVVRKKIRRESIQWIGLQLLNLLCLLVAVAAAVSSIEGFSSALQTYKPFKTKG